MGLLDFFDSPDILASIIGAQNPGVTPGGSFTPPGYMLQPQAPAWSQGGPGPAGGPPPVGNGASPQVASANPPADWTSMPNVGGNADPNSGNLGLTVPPANPGAGPGLTTPAMASPGLPPPNGAVVPPSPVNSMAAAGALPPTVPPGNFPMQMDANGNPLPGAPLNITPQNPMMPPLPGAPLNITPQNPMMPPSPGAAPMAPGGYYGGIARALMPQPANPWGTAIATGMAGLGKGLSAVGAARPGTNAAQMFAAGAGGALQGGTAFQQQQKIQMFNQSSAAFRDMLAAQQVGDTEGLRQAQMNYFNARAKEMNLGGATGSRAYQNSPYWQSMNIENEAQKWEKGQQIILQKRWALNGATTDQQQADLDNLQKNVEGYRQRLYKQAGVDPDKGSSLVNQGTNDKPFQTKGMSLDEFNQTVPMGAWYLDQNGTPRQRTVPPGGALGATNPQGAAPQGNSTQNFYDDQSAMSAGSSDAAIQ